ncbi:hypothetical protein A8U91_01298 [Halomonas elongata]|uniref:Uncharacterized protein n=1 Tax=Halomonas elongata TaxID=2746 RepID=A0A1B8P3Z6_HALEL|nr:hypothetical protein A8U91_01298 [Halomonas elongata]
MTRRGLASTQRCQRSPKSYGSHRTFHGDPLGIDMSTYLHLAP